MMLSTTITFLTVTCVQMHFGATVFENTCFFFVFIQKCIYLFPEYLKHEKHAWIIHPDLSTHTDTHIHTHPNTKPDPRVSQVFSKLFLSLLVKKRERQANAVVFNCHSEEYNVVAGLKYSAHSVSKHNSLNIILDYNSQTDIYLFV